MAQAEIDALCNAERREKVEVVEDPATPTTWVSTSLGLHLNQMIRALEFSNMSEVLVPKIKCSHVKGTKPNVWGRSDPGNHPPASA